MLASSCGHRIQRDKTLEVELAQSQRLADALQAPALGVTALCHNIELHRKILSGL